MDDSGRGRDDNLLIGRRGPEVAATPLGEHESGKRRWRTPGFSWTGARGQTGGLEPPHSDLQRTGALSKCEKKRRTRRCKVDRVEPLEAFLRPERGETGPRRLQSSKPSRGVREEWRLPTNISRRLEMAWSRVGMRPRGETMICICTA